MIVNGWMAAPAELFNQHSQLAPHCANKSALATYGQSLPSFFGNWEKSHFSPSFQFFPVTGTGKPKPILGWKMGKRCEKTGKWYLQKYSKKASAS